MAPPPISAAARAERGRYAVLRRHHPDRPELAEESLRRLRGLRAEDYIRDLGATLTIEQRMRLVGILANPAGGDGDVAA